MRLKVKRHYRHDCTSRCYAWVSAKCFIWNYRSMSVTQRRTGVGRGSLLHLVHTFLILSSVASHQRLKPRAWSYRPLSSHRRGRRLWDHPTSPSLILRGRRIRDFHRPMPVMNTSHQDLATCIYKSIYKCIYKSIYNHMKSKNLHCLLVSVSVATLPCSDSSPLILSRTKFAPKLTSKMLQIRPLQSHVGFHRLSGPK